MDKTISLSSTAPALRSPALPSAQLNAIAELQRLALVEQALRDGLALELTARQYWRELALALPEQREGRDERRERAERRSVTATFADKAALDLDSKLLVQVNATDWADELGVDRSTIASVRAWLANRDLLVVNDEGKGQALPVRADHAAGGVVGRDHGGTGTRRAPAPRPPRPSASIKSKQFPQLM